MLANTAYHQLPTDGSTSNKEIIKLIQWDGKGAEWEGGARII